MTYKPMEPGMTAWHPDVPTELGLETMKVYNRLGLTRNEYVELSLRLTNTMVYLLGPVCLKHVEDMVKKKV